jgi:CopG family transcriptional regulator / antitoxin EndoAI
MMWIEIIKLYAMSKRINIVLPEAIIRTIDRMVKPGHRSRFINEAVQHFVANRSTENRSTEALRAQLEQTAIRDGDIDREVANDWFAVDQQAWPQLDKPGKGQKKATRSAAKSSSPRSTRR